MNLKILGSSHCSYTNLALNFSKFDIADPAKASYHRKANVSVIFESGASAFSRFRY
jgi:hypothetical protein